MNPVQLAIEGLACCQVLTICALVVWARRHGHRLPTLDIPEWNRCAACGAHMQRVTEEQTNKQTIGIWVCARTTCNRAVRRVEEDRS